MKNRKKSNVLPMAAGLTFLAVATLTGLVIGRANAKTGSQGQMSHSSSSTVAAASIYQEEPAAETPADTPAAEPQPSGLQIQQLLAGNYSSLEGTWTNANGHSLTITANGYVDGQGQVQSLSASGYGTARGYLVVETIGGGTIEFLPAGTTLPDYSYDKEGETVTASDASNVQQDRIWLGQDLSTISDASGFYYYVNR